MNDAAKNVHRQVPAGTYVLFSLSFLPRGGISGPYGSSMLKIWGATEKQFALQCITCLMLLNIPVHKYRISI